MTGILPFIISLIWTTATAASAEPAAITIVGHAQALPLDSNDGTSARSLDQPAHATRGTVRMVAATEIVVTRAKQRGDITIELAPATHVDGVIRVGATVSVRYHDDHGRHVATAIAVEPPQPSAGKSGAGAAR